MHRLRVVCAVMVILVGLAVGLVVEAVLLGVAVAAVARINQHLSKRAHLA